MVNLGTCRLKDKRRAAGIVPLKTITDISFYVSHPTMKRNNLIEIKTRVAPPAGAPRTYFMEAPTREEGLRWLDAFQNVRIDSKIVNLAA